MRLFFGLLTVGANLAVLAAVVLALPPFAQRRREVLAVVAGWEYHLALLVALTATLGSLYLSEIAHLVPCTYCWYQRIAMYPLVVILTVAILRRDDGAGLYVAPMAAVGVALSMYHYAVQQVPSLQGTACSFGVPCSTAYLKQFGFMSIPYMAGSAFLLILALLVGRLINSTR